MATQRLFFALWPEDAWQRQLHELARSILSARAGRPVASANLHLTLAFLGSVDRSTRACLEQAADAIHVGAFLVRFDRVGYWAKPRILWLGCSAAPPALAALAAALADAQAACGLVPERRPYVPHLTLARKLARNPGCPAFAPLDWPVERFALVESCADPDGVRYQPLRFWDLGK